MGTKTVGWPLILALWFIANLALPGLASLALGGWYLSRPPLVGMAVELGLIMLPNLALPALALWRAPKVRDVLGWRPAGWRTVAAGAAARCRRARRPAPWGCCCSWSSSWA